MSATAPLYLNSLRVEGVRAIRDLEVRGLGRVNLFVGPNNAGKTSLLEALRLYAARGIPQAFRDVLRGRGDVFSNVSVTDLDEWGVLTEAVRTLFHGGDLESVAPLRLSIGPMDDAARNLVVTTRWAGGEPIQEEGAGSEPFDSSLMLLVVEYANEALRRFSVSRLIGPVHPTVENQVPFATYVAPCGMGEERLGSLWDRVTLTEKESLILDALRIMVPDLDRISYILGARKRFPVAKLQGAAKPFALQRMGDGINRLLAIALAMVNAEGGFLLVDEFENGLYYGVQAQVWEAVFALAEQLNVQVFATTHSWDCIVGFQYAAKRSESPAMLYRLDREEDDRVLVTAYTGEEVGIAAEQHIEVR